MLFRLVRDPGTPLRVPLLCAARSKCSDGQMKLSPREGEAGQAPPQNPRVEIHAQACSPE
jgi:hypothetical protein